MRRCSSQAAVTAVLLALILPFSWAQAQTRKPKREESVRGRVLKHDGGVPPFKAWLDEDVRWIISDEERAAFQRLSNDEERELFVDSFWSRRDPTPDSLENEFKEEHYRRIAYSNELFGAVGNPGWKTDRGHVYILFGPPDQIDAHEEPRKRPANEGEGDGFPFELWRYRYLEEIGQDVEVEFADTCLCGDYKIVHKSKKKGAENLLIILRGKKFEVPNGLDHSAQTQFKDLENVLVTGKIVLNPLQLDVRTDFIKATNATTLVPVTIQFQNRDLVFANNGGMKRSVINILGRVTALTGKIVATFEDTLQVDISPDSMSNPAKRISVYRNVLPLHPGLYRLSVAAKVVTGDINGTWSRGLRVPDYPVGTLATSSLIFAEKIEVANVQSRVTTSDGKLVPFKHGDAINVWMQAYNLVPDQSSHRPSVLAVFNVVDAAGRVVISRVEEIGKVAPLGDQVTLKQLFDSSNLQPGGYSLRVKVTDNVSKQVVENTADFAVE